MPKQEPDMTEPPMPEGPMPPNGDMPMGPDNGPQNAPEPPIDGAPDVEPMEGENKEIDDIFGKLDTEKQAAVIKYAKSMINDTEEPPVEDVGEDIPMENKKQLGKLVNEIVNNILNGEDSDEDEEDRKDEKIRNKKVTKDNPYVSKR